MAVRGLPFPPAAAKILIRMMPALGTRGKRQQAAGTGTGAQGWDRMIETGRDIDAAIIGALSAVAPEVQPDGLDPDRPFRDQIELDSVDFLGFVLGLEKRLSLKVPELDYPQLSTLDGCRVYLRTRMDS